MVKDSVSNLITKIKNAGLAGKLKVEVDYSKLTESILTLLQREGYITSFASKDFLKNKVVKSIEVVLAFEDGRSKVEGVERVSKLSRRVYSGASTMRPVRSGYGMLVVSTPKGILSDREAKKLNVGGEVLFKIW